MDSSRSSLAFGELGMPKLRSELTSIELITRQKALVTLSDLMHSIERVHEAVRVGCMQQIITLLIDTDETIRFKSVAVLQIMLQHTVGREAFLNMHNGLSKLVELFDDKSIKIKLTAFQSLKTLTDVPNYARQIVTDKYVGLCNQLVEDHLHFVEDDLSGEALEVVKTCLDIIHNLLFVEPNGSEDAASAKTKLSTLQAVTTLIQHDNARVRTKACVTMHDLCANSKVAKDSASTDNVIITTLVNLLQDKDKSVRISACQALMTIAITTDGKLTAVKLFVVPKLLSLIDEAITCSTPENLDKATDDEGALNDSLRLYSIRAAQVVSEVPKARQIFATQENVQKFQQLANNNRLSSDVRRAAAETISVIQWIP